ncbi:MAG: VOC family protein [Gemmatimonadota bacterium]|nr:VOC family protein [Gemmatimonadota bacterium]
MLTLNHANLPVPDVISLRDFFVRHFGFTQLNQDEGTRFVVLRGGAGFILNLMQASAGDPGGFPKNFHVGFMVETTEEVHETHARLTTAGVECGPAEAMNRRGTASVTFYCHAPNQILVEVSCYSA